jgi:hypothetical protein
MHLSHVRARREFLFLYAKILAHESAIASTSIIASISKFALFSVPLLPTRFDFEKCTEEGSHNFINSFNKYHSIVTTELRKWYVETHFLACVTLLDDDD